MNMLKSSVGKQFFKVCLENDIPVELLQPFTKSGTRVSKQPIRAHYLGHVTGYSQSGSSDRYLLIQSVPDFSLSIV